MSADQNATAAGRLCTLYWLPVYTYLRCKGQSLHDAEDITQDFFLDALRRNEFTKLKPTGRFRAFLQSALRHHLSNRYKRESAQKRGGGRKPLIIDFDIAEGQLRSTEISLTPEEIYDRKWAEALIDHVLKQLEMELDKEGNAELFELLRPQIIADPDALPAAKLGKQVGKSPGAVRIAAYRLRKRFAKLLREEVAATLDSEDLVESEIEYLMNLFSK